MSAYYYAQKLVIFTRLQMYGLRQIFIVFFLLLSAKGMHAQFYNGSQQTFGKNRIQYQEFLWNSLNFQRFKVYYYTGGEDLAVYAAKSAQKHMEEVEAWFDYRIEDKLEILVFKNQSDFKQSNIGITTEESTNVGGVARIVGNKLFVFYEGTHEQLDAQIKSAISDVMVSKLIYGNSWKDQIKSSTMLTFPSWYLEGFKSYAGQGWNEKLDNEVKNKVLNGDFAKFNSLEGRDADLAGHAVWNYIASKFSPKIIPNVLYIARMSRSIENGFLIVLGMDMENFAIDFHNYYKKKYEGDNAQFQEPNLNYLEIKNKRNAVYTQFKMSSDGRYAAYAYNLQGQVRIYVFDTQTKKKYRVFKDHPRLERSADLSYPVLNWHPNYNVLTFFTERKGNLEMRIHTVKDKRTDVIDASSLEKVLDFSYAPSGTEMVVSGVRQGQTDIYLFSISSKLFKPLTNDIYDDLHPEFVSENEIIFASNRYDDTLRRQKLKPEEIQVWKNDYDIFVIRKEKNNKRYQIIRQVTDTDYANEFHPSAYLGRDYTFVSDQNGIYNRFVASYDSAIAYVDTAIHYRYFSKIKALSNYNTGVLQYQMNTKQNMASMMVLKDGKYKFGYLVTSNDAMLEVGQLPLTAYKKSVTPVAPKVDTTSKVNSGEKIFIEEEKFEIDVENYRFEDEEPEFEEEVKRLDKENDIIAEERKIEENKAKELRPDFEMPSSTIYSTNFAMDYVVTQLDNNQLNQSYQRYSGPGAIYNNVGLNGLFKAGASDLFEDYKLLGGFRLAPNLRTAEYLVSFENLRKRVDHKWLGYRNAFFMANNAFEEQKLVTHELKYRASYPFSEVLSLRGTVGYRNDQIITMASNDANIDEPTYMIHLGSAKVELVFDNTRNKGLNLYNGIRFKLFGEYFKEIRDERPDIFVGGGDFRFYQKVHKDIIWANRVAFAYTGGDQAIIHYLGGVDSWVLRFRERFDDAVQVPQDMSFAFQTLATPMRGFIQNIRNGNNFAVANSELRVPVFKYFSNQPLKSDFLENFQVVGFFDVGAAWTGLHPYHENNSFNTIVTQYPEDSNDPAILVEIENLKEPIVYGYGFGLRSRISGYFVRFDWAWGVDDHTTLPSIRYLSLSLDF